MTNTTLQIWWVVQLHERYGFLDVLVKREDFENCFQYFGYSVAVHAQYDGIFADGHGREVAVCDYDGVGVTHLAEYFEKFGWEKWIDSF